jgi:CheY-like chemotaxis protein
LPFDILLLDLALPDAFGSEIIREFALDPRSSRLKIVIITGHLAQGEEETFLSQLEPKARALVASSQWSRARVNIDYHIVFDANFYSVPYNLVQELVEVRSSPTTVELFHRGQRVASHQRARGHGHTVTIAEHRPRSHQAHLEWTPSRMVHWAQTIGPHTSRLFERIMSDKPHRRWATVHVWGSFASPGSTHQHAWKPPPSGHL